eukprot:6212503-Pleurochrysis_carterae.AAC.4
MTATSQRTASVQPGTDRRRLAAGDFSSSRRPTLAPTMAGGEERVADGGATGGLLPEGLPGGLLVRSDRQRHAFKPGTLGLRSRL